MNLFKTNSKAALWPSRAAALMAVVISSLVTTPARARDFTWDGEYNNLWDRNSGPPNRRTNWRPEGMSGPIPNADDNVFFSGSAPEYTINLNGNRSVLSATFSGDFDYTLIENVGTDTLTLLTGNINASGTATHGITAKVVLQADGVWAINNPEFWVSGTINGAYQLKKTGTGTLTLTGGDATTPSDLHRLWAANGDIVLDGAYINLTGVEYLLELKASGGDLTIQNGAVVQTSAGTWGRVQNNTLTITGSGSLLDGDRLTAGNTSGNSGSILVEQSASVVLDNDLIIGWDGDSDLTVQTGASTSADQVILGVTDTGVALVTGDSSVLSSTNLYLGGYAGTQGGTGTLTVEDGGAVQVTGETKFWDPNGTSSITIDGGTFETDWLTNDTGVVATVSISDPDANTPGLTVGTGNGSSTFDGLLQDAPGNSRTLEKVGTGTFTLTGANTFSGFTSISGGQIIIDNANALQSSTVTLKIDDGLDVTTNSIDAVIGGLSGLGGLDLGSQTLTVGNNNRGTTYKGIISGAGSLIKIGTGKLKFTANNSYSGTTTIDGGSLQIGNDGNTGSIAGDVINNASLIFYRSNDLTFAGDISGTGSLTKEGAGTLTLTGANTYSGGTTIKNGIIAVSADTNLGAATSPLFFNGGDLLFGASFDLDPARAITLQAGGGKIRTNVFNTTISQGITGAGGLVKEGTGTLTLTGANTYSGGTTINSGTLLAGNTTGSATGSGAVQLESGATLGGNGSVSGAVTVNSGGTVAPGTSAGTLTLTSVTFESGSTLSIELGGTTPGTGHDNLVVEQTAQLGGTLDLSYIDPFTASPGDSFVILSASSLVGEFDTVNSPDGQIWAIEYDSISGTVTVGICTDSDGDGVCDADDICPGFDDTIDSDADDVPDDCDICPGSDDNMDSDGDGTPDGCDIEVVIEFDAGPTGSMPSYSEDGFIIVPSEGSLWIFDDDGRNPRPILVESVPFTLAATDDAAFDLLALDVSDAENRSVPRTWRAEGSFASGGSITQDFDVAGGYRTVTFDGFQSLASVTFSPVDGDYAVSWDNFVVRKRAAGDCDGDGDVALDDYADFSACLLGPDGGFSMDCECSDFDNDWDVDLDDFAEFQMNFTGY